MSSVLQRMSKAST